VHHLQHFVSTYGVWAVVLLVTVEGLGAPVPGETVLVTAAAFAARGHLSIIAVVLASTLGTLLGGTGGYWIGHAGGGPLLRRHGRLIGISPERLDRACAIFDRHGAKTIFFARFVALLRIIAGILAGITRMPFGRFSFYNAAGGLLWSITFGALGFLFGKSLRHLERILGRASLVLLGVFVVVGAAAWWWHTHRGTNGAATGGSEASDRGARANAGPAPDSEVSLLAGKSPADVPRARRHPGGNASAEYDGGGERDEW
jgi:membrane protein DedA with SNARE-associated domain